ncbi:MAG: UDP-N-acetylmuramoyl-tripeptide--D-alanyl-D-alanine ligase [Planctomycetota bacterium]|mgnify:CR=1 FL=1
MSFGTATVNMQRPAPFRLRADDAERLCAGRWYGQTREVTIRGAAIDSRKVAPGCLFACLRGERADGHDFAEIAVGTGASLILAERVLKVPVPVLVVRDVATALAALASEFRSRVTGTIWIGVAGANGKTTTKELIAAACRAAGREPVLVTQGNLNNHLGVPLTVFSLPERARFAVIELGSNHPGELPQLAAIAKPDIGCVVSIGPEHLEGFADLAGVTREECSLFTAQPASAAAFLGTYSLATQAAHHGTNAEALLTIARHAAAGRTLHVSGPADSTGDVLRTPAGEARLRLLGAHNHANAWLAYQVAVAAGVPAAAALSGIASVKATPGRLRPLQAGPHLIIDDCYNANPASMEAGLMVLAGYSGRRLAVLGHMGELGAASKHGHELVGATAASLGVALIAVGPLAAPILASYRNAGGTDGQTAADRTLATTLATAWMRGGAATVLIKGSRSAHLESVVDALCVAHGLPAPGGVH